MWPWFLECLKRPVCKEEKVHCCVVWVAHSPGQGAAVTLALNSGSSLSDVDECVGDLKRLFFSLFLLPAVWKKNRPWPLQTGCRHIRSRGLETHKETRTCHRCTKTQQKSELHRKWRDSKIHNGEIFHSVDIRVGVCYLFYTFILSF